MEALLVGVERCGNEWSAIEELGLAGLAGRSSTDISSEYFSLVRMTKLPGPHFTGCAYTSCYSATWPSNGHSCPWLQSMSVQVGVLNACVLQTGLVPAHTSRVGRLHAFRVWVQQHAFLCMHACMLHQACCRAHTRQHKAVCMRMQCHD